jgi:predicted transcriptional regulator
MSHAAGSRRQVTAVGWPTPTIPRRADEEGWTLMTTRYGRRAPGSLEAAVMTALWQGSADEPLTPGDVQAHLGDGLAYNTVQTILIRLHEKGLVERRKAGRSHAYWAVNDAATTAATQMSAMLSGRGDRQAVLQQFAAALDPHDAAVLRDLLGGRP